MKTRESNERQRTVVKSKAERQIYASPLFASVWQLPSIAGSRSGKSLSAATIDTISREAGSGAVTIGQMLVERLNATSKSSDSPSWTVFDSNLAKQVLVDHQLPDRLEQFMVEDSRLPVETIVEELLGLHPTPWLLVQQTTRTSRQLIAWRPGGYPRR